MNVLLLSMPDSFEHMPPIVARMPHGALSSLAGNVDPHHRVAVADLILAQRHVRATVEQLLTTYTPAVVGLSVMTFQRDTAKKIIRLIRQLRPEARVVVGGYDPTLDTAAYTGPDDGVDFIVRGEGEATFCALLRAIEGGGDYTCVAGLSYRCGGEFVHNPDRPPQRLDRGEVKLPSRAARVLSGYTMLGRQIDVIETSRGCTFDCSFCSIIEMRGRNFFTFPIERVIADIRDAHERGTRAIFMIDDNITLNVQRFADLCRAIIAAGLNDIDYTIQGMTSAIADHGAWLAPLMRAAGFRYVFLGIENILDADLQFLKASSKNTRHEQGRRAGNASLQAINYIRRNNMYVVGGLIVGNPDDTHESIEANLAFARRHVDWPYIQHPTPYPRTPMTRGFQEQGLIINDRLEEYDGTTAVVRTRHLSAEEIEYLRWRAERWIKLRHMPVALAHSPGYVLRHMARMAAHTFRGSTLQSLLGLEDERAAFTRYRAIRARERVYL